LLANISQNVLHDWVDDDCIRILKRCKEAIEPKKDGSKVIVVDIIHGDNDLQSTETGFLFDILMMSCRGSKERCKQEWHDIILSAGYSGYEVHPALGVHSVMELFP
jgi:O-methyltransferase domain